MSRVSALQNVVRLRATACIIGHAGSTTLCSSLCPGFIKAWPRDRWRKRGVISHLSRPANYALVQRSMHAYTMTHSETKKPKPLERLIVFHVLTNCGFDRLRNESVRLCEIENGIAALACRGATRIEVTDKVSAV